MDEGGVRDLRGTVTEAVPLPRSVAFSTVMEGRLPQERIPRERAPASAGCPWEALGFLRFFLTSFLYINFHIYFHSEHHTPLNKQINYNSIKINKDKMKRGA